VLRVGSSERTPNVYRISKTTRARREEVVFFFFFVAGGMVKKKKIIVVFVRVERDTATDPPAREYISADPRYQHG
jgi:hypothetical protein